MLNIENGFLKLPLTNTLMHDHGFVVEYDGRHWDSSQLFDLVWQTPESAYPKLYERLCGVSREVTDVIRRARGSDLELFRFLGWWENPANVEGLIEGLEALNAGIVSLEEVSQASRRLVLARGAGAKEPLYLTGVLHGSNGSFTMPEGSRFLFTVNRYPFSVPSGKPGECDAGTYLRPELQYTASSLDCLLAQTPGAIYSVEELSLGCTESVQGLRSLLISDYVRVKRKIYNERLESYPHVN